MAEDETMTAEDIARLMEHPASEAQLEWERHHVRRALARLQAWILLGGAA